VTKSGRIKVESIEEIKDSEKTKLSRSYTFWILMKKQNQGHSGAEGAEHTYDSDLKAVATFNTVRYAPSLKKYRLKISGPYTNTSAVPHR
jgi:hypothetical protein